LVYSVPPKPSDDENKKDVDDGVQCSIICNLLDQDSINKEKKPAATKPIVEALARQPDSSDKSILAAILMSEGLYICNHC
jgi:hypothetical protein